MHGEFRIGDSLIMIGLGKLETGSETDPIIKQLYEDAFGRHYSGPRKYIDEEYKTIPFPFNEIPAPRFSIRVEWTPDRLEGFFNSWSAIQAMKEKKGINPAEKTMEKIRSITGTNPIEGFFPVFLRLGRIPT